MMTEQETVYMLVLSKPTPGDEDEFNRWYSHRHITDVLIQVPGVRSVQRFALAEEQRRRPPYAYTHLAVYNIDKGQAKSVFADLEKRSGTEVMPISGTFDPDHLALVYEPITEKITPETAEEFANACPPD